MEDCLVILQSPSCPTGDMERHEEPFPWVEQGGKNLSNWIQREGEIISSSLNWLGDHKIAWYAWRASSSPLAHTGDKEQPLMDHGNKRGRLAESHHKGHQNTNHLTICCACCVITKPEFGPIHLLPIQGKNNKCGSWQDLWNRLQKPNEIWKDETPSVVEAV